MQRFRKNVLPFVWVVVFAVIAVSLAKMAFFPSNSTGTASAFEPTGSVPGYGLAVSRMTLDNTMELSGTITVDPDVPVPAGQTGVINHIFVASGTQVNQGEPLFQVRVEGEAPSSSDDSDEPAPAAQPTYHTVVAPASGTVGSFAQRLNTTVDAADIVVSLRQNTFRATANIAPVDRYRLLDLPDKATVGVENGPPPFSCSDLTINDSASSTVADDDDPRDDSSGGATLTCVVPSNVQVFNGLSASISVDMGSAEDVLVVPITAIRGTFGSGTIWVFDDAGEPVEREVELGITDGEWVEVTSGAEEGEEILEFVPGTEQDLYGEMPMDFDEFGNPIDMGDDYYSEFEMEFDESYEQ